MLFASGSTKARGAVLVIHENRGLPITSGRCRRAGRGRLHRAGASTCSPRRAGPRRCRRGRRHGRARQAPAGAADRRPAGGSRRARAARTRTPSSAMIGFCFGGGMTWQLLAAGEPRLAAAVPFYGPPSDTRLHRVTEGCGARRCTRSSTPAVNATQVPPPRRRSKAAGWRMRSGSTRRRPRLLQRHRPALQRRAGSRRPTRTCSTGSSVTCRANGIRAAD